MKKRQNIVNVFLGILMVMLICFGLHPVKASDETNNQVLQETGGGTDVDGNVLEFSPTYSTKNGKIVITLNIEGDINNIS